MPKRDERILGGACFVGLESMLDLGRLSCALERAPFPLFAFKHGGATRIAAQADLYMGTPIFYYCDADASGEYLAYKPPSGEVDEVQLVHAASNAAFVYAPIIRITKMPKQLDARDDFKDKFMAIEVNDLASLVRVATYKMLFEEPPLPLFAFKDGQSWTMGTFARIDDYEEASIFFHCKTEEPTSGFVRYAPDKPNETAFVRRTNDPGFYPVKVVRLSEKHPLVQL